MSKNKSDIALKVGIVVGHFSDNKDVNWFAVTKDAINLLLEQMSETLSEGKRIEIRGFGSFKLKIYEGVARFRNPKTGEVTKKRRKPKAMFKAGKEMRECLKNRTLIG